MQPSELWAGRGGGGSRIVPTLALMRKDETIDPFLEQVRMEESRHSFQTKYDIYRFIYTECVSERLWYMQYVQLSTSVWSSP